VWIKHKNRNVPLSILGKDTAPRRPFLIVIPLPISLAIALFLYPTDAGLSETFQRYSNP